MIITEAIRSILVHLYSKTPASWFDDLRRHTLIPTKKNTFVWLVFCCCYRVRFYFHFVILTYNHILPCMLSLCSIYITFLMNGAISIIFCDSFGKIMKKWNLDSFSEVNISLNLWTLLIRTLSKANLNYQKFDGKCKNFSEENLLQISLLNVG